MLYSKNHVILIHFNDVLFIPGENRLMRQIYVQLSAKLTKAFRICLKALFNFFSQEIFCEKKISFEFR